MTSVPWAQPVLSAKECAGQHKQQILAGLHLCVSGFSKQLPLLYKGRDFGNADLVLCRVSRAVVSHWVTAAPWLPGVLGAGEDQPLLVPQPVFHSGSCCSHYCWLMSRLSSAS